MRRKPNQQTGSAIVAVLLVVAVISIIAVGLMMQQRIDIRRTQQIQTSNQAYHYSEAVLYWAMSAIILSQNAPPQPEGELWQSDFPETTIANHRGKTSGHLERLDQRTNLNSFTESSSSLSVSNLATLLSKSNPGLAEAEVTQIMKNITDWISPSPTDGDRYYLSLNPPYAAAHTSMVSPSEMRLVVGVDADTYRAIVPYIITLPGTKEKNPDYYLLQADVVLDDQSLRVYSILHQENSGPKPSVKVVWSTRGTW